MLEVPVMREKIACQMKVWLRKAVDWLTKHKTRLSEAAERGMCVGEQLCM